MIIPTDITFRLSGGSGNADPLLSLGGVKSSVAVGNKLFNTVDEAEATAGSVKYMCIYVHNANSADPFLNSKLWLMINTPSAFTVIDIGIGTAAVNGTEQTIANDTTAPSGVTFSAPSTRETALAVSNIPTVQHQSIWLRRTVTAGATVLDNDGCTVGFGSDE